MACFMKAQRVGALGNCASGGPYFDHLDSMTAVTFVHAVALVANILFMLGFKSRTMGIISVIAHTALYQRNSWFMNGGDRLVREFGFYICLVHVARASRSTRG